MLTVTMKELLEAGVHFGHQTKRWNPKMKEFIFGQRNGIYIIDLQKTIKLFKEALQFISEVSESGREVLMVGTKKQAQDIIKEYAEKSEACYVNQRWLGGLLTNFEVIRGSVEKLKDFEEMKEDGRWDLLSKKEQSRKEKVFRKLTKNLGGIKTMLEPPGAIFIIDSTKEDIAIQEAQKLNIPLVAVVDSNGNPDEIEYPIPGNDDAVRAIELFTSKVTEAIMQGKQKKLERELQQQKENEEEESAAAEQDVPVNESETASESPEVTPAEVDVPTKETEDVTPPSEPEKTE